MYCLYVSSYTHLLLHTLTQMYTADHESHKSEKLEVMHLLGDDSLSVVFEGELDADIATCVAFAREWDLVKDWNGFVIKSEILRVVSMLEMIVSAEVWMPWPFKNRTSILTPIQSPSHSHKHYTGNLCVRTVGYDVTSEMGCFFIRMTPEDPRYSDPYVYFFLFEPHTHTHPHTHTQRGKDDTDLCYR